MPIHFHLRTAKSVDAGLSPEIFVHLCNEPQHYFSFTVHYKYFGSFVDIMSIIGILFGEYVLLFGIAK